MRLVVSDAHEGLKGAIASMLLGSVSYIAFPFAHWRKIWSTNPLERANNETPVLEWSLPWVTVPRSDSMEISDATSTWWLSSA